MTRILALLILGLALLDSSLAHAHAHAQGCAAGIPSAGNPACIPPDRENSPYYQGGGGNVLPKSNWKLTWGAIASDRTTGSTGVEIGKFSEREAKNAALKACAKDGSKKCQVKLVFHNQCAVIVDPPTENNRIAGTSIYRGGPSIESATEGGLTLCHERNPGKKCQVVYSICTDAVRLN